MRDWQMTRKYQRKYYVFRRSYTVKFNMCRHVMSVWESVCTELSRITNKHHTHTHTNNSNVMCRYEFHKLYPMYTILVLFITTDLLCLLSIIVPIVWSYKLFTVCAIRSQSHVYIHQLIMQWFWVVSFWSVTMQTHFYRSLANKVGFTF